MDDSNNKLLGATADTVLLLYELYVNTFVYTSVDAVANGLGTASRLKNCIVAIPVVFSRRLWDMA